jgi:hypothetical protein
MENLKYVIAVIRYNNKIWKPGLKSQLETSVNIREGNINSGVNETKV